MERKFSRSINFSAREENILLSLVKKYKDQVECKKSDTNTHKIKAEAWVEITKVFNSNVGEPYRSDKVLKNKYENIKKRAKKKFADHKKYITGTGGGPSKDIVVTDIDSSIHEILGTQLTGLPSEFDGDATDQTIILQVEDTNWSSGDESMHFNKLVDVSETPRTHKNENKAVTMKIESVASSTENTVQSLSDVNAASTSIELPNSVMYWATYTPSMLKKPLSRPLQNSENKDITVVKKKNTQGLGAKLGEWAKFKSKYSDVQEKAFEEKHLLSMRQMKEKHEQHLAIQKEESEIRIKFLTEEHQMKMKLLEKEMSGKF